MSLLKAPVCLLWSCFPTDPYCVGSMWVAVTVYTYTHPGSLHWEVELPVPDVGIHSWTLWYVALRDLSCSNSGSQTCSRCIVMSLDLFPPSFSFLSFLPLSLSSLPLFPPSLSFPSPSLSPLPSILPPSLSSPVVPPRHQSMSISNFPQNYQGANGGRLPHKASLPYLCLCSRVVWLTVVLPASSCSCPAPPPSSSSRCHYWPQTLRCPTSTPKKNKYGSFSHLYTTAL